MLVLKLFKATNKQTKNIRQETEVTSKPTSPVEKIVIKTKGLQERNIQMLDRATVDNKGKTINKF